MTDDDVSEVFGDPTAYVEPLPPRRTYRRRAVAPVVEPDDGPTWRPDGGPEMNRYSGELTPEILSRFRAHSVTGGHQKRPDQRGIGEGGWYLPVTDRRQGEVRLARDIAKLRPRVRDPKLFDKLMVDDGACGGQKWAVNGHRVTSTSIWTAFYACRILELTEGRGVKSAVDIGGGYGHLAHVLAGFFPTVTVVELPIVLALAKEWSAAHPATADRVTLVHPYEDWSGDLVVNTMSMQHMTAANLDWYDQRFRAAPPQCIYLVNRVVKRDPTDVEFRDYPFLPLFNVESERRVTGKHVEYFGLH